MVKKLGSLGLAASVLWAVISLIFKGGIGVTHADGLDFNFTGAKAEITHETANCPGENNTISCLLTGGLTSPTLSGSFLTGFDSDSYEILANLALFDAAEFNSDLNNDIEIALAPGNCDLITSNPTSLPVGTWTGFIPGSALHQVVNKSFTIYNFEANIPASLQACPFLNCSTSIFFPLSFDRLELNLKIPTAATTATLSLEGNANLCSITGPTALALYILDEDGDPDFSCVNIPTPEFDTLDVSQAFCPLLRVF
jgi:hypothetical protein